MSEPTYETINLNPAETDADRQGIQELYRELYKGPFDDLPELERWTKIQEKARKVLPPTLDTAVEKATKEQKTPPPQPSQT